MQKKIKKIFVSILVVLVVLLSGAVYFGSNFLVNYAIGRMGDGANRQVSLEVDEEMKLEGIELVIDENIKEQQKRSEAFLKKHEAKTITLTSNDDLQLQGYYYANSGHNYVIAIHGYRGSGKYMTSFAERYYEQGYSVLLPDLRCCGDSEGDYVGMGWLDKEDMLGWIDYIVSLDKDANIIIHGVSMGAATTMMTSGICNDDHVKVYIEDCGYTSVWDIFSSELALRFHMPEFPLMQVANVISKKKAGYAFDEASSLEMVSCCEKPMLFIHGTADDFIPYDMLQVLYDAKPGNNKKKISVEGAGHGQAMYALGNRYWQEVFTFIDEYK